MRSGTEVIALLLSLPAVPSAGPSQRIQAVTTGQPRLLQIDPDLVVRRRSRTDPGPRPCLRDCDPGPHWGCTPPDDHGQQRIATVSRPHRSVAVARVRPGRSMTRIVSRTEEVKKGKGRPAARRGQVAVAVKQLPVLLPPKGTGAGQGKPLPVAAGSRPYADTGRAAGTGRGMAIQRKDRGSGGPETSGWSSGTGGSGLAAGGAGQGRGRPPPATRRHLCQARSVTTGAGLALWYTARLSAGPPKPVAAGGLLVGSRTPLPRSYLALGVGCAPTGRWPGPSGPGR
jgi:hypothetical protein